MHRQNTALWPKAHERYLARMNRRGGSVLMQVTSGRGPALPDVRQETVRFWWAPPDRLREEVTSNTPGGTRRVVHSAGLWWIFGDAMDPVTNESLDEEEQARHGAGGGEQFRPLFDPSGLIPAVEFDDIRPGDGVLHVVARPRDDLERPQHHHLHLVGGADRFELEVDAKLGIVRATTAFIDGEELSSVRLEEVALGETFADDVFARPAGIDFAPAGGHVGTVTLEEAAAEAPFPVFFVPDLPDGVWRLHANRIRKPHFTVWLVYHRADGRESFSLGQSAEPTFEPAGDEVERDGTTYVVGERSVAFEREGTQLLLQSDSLTADALLDLAASLKRFAR